MNHTHIHTVNAYTVSHSLHFLNVFLLLLVEQSNRMDQPQTHPSTRSCWRLLLLTLQLALSECLRQLLQVAHSQVDMLAVKVVSERLMLAVGAL